MNEHAILRRAGIVACLSIPGNVTMLALGAFPYPDNNRPGQEYYDYLTHRHTAELGVLSYFIIVYSALTFMLLLAYIYQQREGRTTIPVLMIIGGMIAFIASMVALMASWVAPAFMAHGNPSFGHSETDLTIFQDHWHTAQLMWTFGVTLLAPVWAGIYLANRRHPILPRWLGHWGALLSIATSATSPLFMFVTTGPWSPTSVFQYLLTAFPTWGWITTTGIYLLLRNKTHRNLSRHVATPNEENKRMSPSTPEGCRHTSRESRPGSASPNQPARRPSA